MDQHRAYRLLAAELERWRSRPRAEVIALVDQPPVVASETTDDHSLRIEVTVRWADLRRTRLQVRAVAFGPGTWYTERLDEALVLPAD